MLGRRFRSIAVTLLTLGPGLARAQLFSDDFNRTTGLGTSWRIWYGSFTTDGTYARSGPATAADAGNWASVVPNVGTDYSVAADVLIPAGSQYSGIVARGSAGSDFTSDLYAAQLSTDGGVRLYRRNGWTWTLLGAAPAGVVADTRYALRLVVTGSSPVHLEVWLDGVNRITFDDASPGRITVGAPGLENFDGNVRYDSFAVYPSGALPAAPTNLSATALSQSSVQLSWTASIGTVAGYYVEQAPDSSGTPGAFAQIGFTTSPGYTPGGLSGGTTYWYRVRAYNANGPGPYSNQARVTTSAGTAPTIASFSPASGGRGDTVSIAGTNLTGATSVTVGGVAATFATLSSTSILAVVPSGAPTGRITVATAGGPATTGASFTVTTSDNILASNDANLPVSSWVGTDPDTGDPTIMTFAYEGGSRVSLTEVGSSEHFIQTWNTKWTAAPTLNAPYEFSARIAAGSRTSASVQIQTYGMAWPASTFDLTTCTATDANGATHTAARVSGQANTCDVTVTGRFVSTAASHLGASWNVSILTAPGAAAAGKAIYVENVRLRLAGGPGPTADIGAYALISDTNPRTPTPFALPAYVESNPVSTSFVDPVYGTRIIRVTGNPGDTFLGGALRWRTDKPWTTPVYPLYPAWNADQTRFFIQGGAEIASTGVAAKVISDGSTYAPLSYLPAIKTEYRWHPTNPHLMVWVDTDGTAGTVDVTTGVYTTLFSSPPAGFDPAWGTMGQYEGNPSNDGRYVPIQGKIAGEDVVFVADLLLGTRSQVWRATEFGFSSLDGTKMSPLGNYIIVSSAWGVPNLALDFKTGLVASSRNFVGHNDIILDENGDEVAYIPGQAVMWRLRDGVDRPVGGPTAVQYHTSTRNLAEPGWGYADFEPGDNNLGGELFAREMKTTSPRLRRICATRATYSGYEHTGWGVPSPDGLRVSFRSDWGDPFGPTYGFIVDVREAPRL